MNCIMLQKLYIKQLNIVLLDKKIFPNSENFLKVKRLRITADKWRQNKKVDYKLTEVEKI